MTPDDEATVALLAAVVARLKDILRATTDEDEITRFHLETSLRAAENALARMTRSPVERPGPAAADQSHREAQARSVGAQRVADQNAVEAHACRVGGGASSRVRT
jgi:hypothetical protein